MLYCGEESYFMIMHRKITSEHSGNMFKCLYWDIGFYCFNIIHFVKNEKRSVHYQLRNRLCFIRIPFGHSMRRLCSIIYHCICLGLEKTPLLTHLQKHISHFLSCEYNR